MNNIDKMVLRDDEGFCDNCNNYRNCIEWFNGEYYMHICYKCIDEIKPKELPLYSNTKDPHKEQLETDDGFVIGNYNPIDIKNEKEIFNKV